MHDFCLDKVTFLSACRTCYGLTLEVLNKIKIANHYFSFKVR